MIAGAKALLAASDEVFGAGQAVQRARNPKRENVLQELPKEQHAQVGSLLRANAAYKLERAAEGMAKIEKMAEWLDAGVSGGCSQSARRAGGNLHHQAVGLAAELAPLLGDDQPDRKPAVA